MKSSVLILLLSLCSFSKSQLGKKCITPNKENAHCIPLSKCDSIRPKTIPEFTEERKKFLKESYCGHSSDNEPLVCCGYKSNYYKPNIQSFIFDTLPVQYKINQLLPNRGICGEQIYSDRIYSGTVCSIDEYPWMALLEYRNIVGDSKGHNCGGVLISSRYILTAAHCIRDWQLYKVRLGEHDLSTEVDCVDLYGDLDCNNPPVDYLIEDIIVHPDYFYNHTAVFNDIALIRLQTEVQFTDFIKPICLPLNCESSKVGDRLYVAGWGKTEHGTYSNVKLKVDLIISDHEYCKDVYSQMKISIANETQICALGSKGKDSCKGDSGGPLMRVFPNASTTWFVEGLVSFGPKWCADEQIPGVYTNVVPFLKWILENMTI